MIKRNGRKERENFRRVIGIRAKINSRVKIEHKPLKKVLQDSPTAKMERKDLIKVRFNVTIVRRGATMRMSASTGKGNRSETTKKKPTWLKMEILTLIQYC